MVPGNVEIMNAFLGGKYGSQCNLPFGFTGRDAGRLDACTGVMDRSCHTGGADVTAEAMRL